MNNKIKLNEQLVKLIQDNFKSNINEYDNLQDYLKELTLSIDYVVYDTHYNNYLNKKKSN